MGLESTPRPGEKGYEKLKTATLKSLLEGVWIIGQAAEWNIHVTRQQVERELERVKEENFRSGAEFRQFLKEAHYTYRDVRERVRTQILSTRLQERLKERIGRVGRKAEQDAFLEFVDEFNERWRARTVCAPEYAIERCSNGPLPAAQARSSISRASGSELRASLRLPAS